MKLQMPVHFYSDHQIRKIDLVIHTNQKVFFFFFFFFFFCSVFHSNEMMASVQSVICYV